MLYHANFQFYKAYPAIFIYAGFVMDYPAGFIRHFLREKQTIDDKYASNDVSPK